MTEGSEMVELQITGVSERLKPQVLPGTNSINSISLWLSASRRPSQVKGSRFKENKNS